MYEVKKRLKRIEKVKNILILHQNNEILGTAKDEKLDIINDYDLQEYANFEDNKYIYEIIYNKFKEIIKNIKKDDKLFLIDFKLGRLPSTEQIRWNYNDVMKGYKIIEDEKIWFVDLLQQKSIIKIDLLYVDNSGKIWEISNNYYLKIGDDSTYNIYSIDYIKKNLLLDFKKLYYIDGNIYKSLKRLYSYHKINDNNKSILKKFHNLFNSEIGYHNKIISDLKIILLLIEKEKYNKIKDIIYNNISILIDNKNNSKYLNYLKKIIENFKNISKNQLINNINDIINIIYNDINEKTKEYINKYNLINNIDIII